MTTDIADDLLLTPKAVAEKFGMNELTLANLRSQRRGPAFIRIGRSIRYPRSAIREFLTKRLVLL